MLTAVYTSVLFQYKKTPTIIQLVFPLQQYFQLCPCLVLVISISATSIIFLYQSAKISGKITVRKLLSFHLSYVAQVSQCLTVRSEDQSEYLYSSVYLRIHGNSPHEKVVPLFWHQSILLQ